MKPYYRPKKTTPIWIYLIVAVCILLLTVCILSLLPSAEREPTPQTPSTDENNGQITPSLTSSANTSQNGNPSDSVPNGNPSDSVQDGNPSDAAQNGSLSDADGSAPMLRISINPKKLSAVQQRINQRIPSPSVFDSEEHKRKLLALEEEREALLLERERIQTQYQKEVSERKEQQTKLEAAQKSQEQEVSRLTSELETTEAKRAAYQSQQDGLIKERSDLSEEERELQEQENALQLLKEDIDLARAMLLSERQELELTIQSIKQNTGLSPENMEAALLPLYAELEQLLIREAELSHSESEYSERADELLTQSENLAARIHANETAQEELIDELSQLSKKEQSQDEALRRATDMTAATKQQLSKLNAEEARKSEEYEDKLRELSLAEEKITATEQRLKEQAASPLPESSPIDLKNILTLERIALVLRDVALYEIDSNEILLEDIADILLIPAKEAAP